MANWLTLSPESALKIRQAWEKAVVKTAIETTHHLPLIVGGTLTALVEIVRTAALPHSDKLSWVILEFTVTGAELLLLASLVVGNALELVGELTERVSIIYMRVRKTQRTGKRPPEGS